MDGSPGTAASCPVRAIITATWYHQSLIVPLYILIAPLLSTSSCDLITTINVVWLSSAGALAKKRQMNEGTCPAEYSSTGPLYT